MIIIRISNKENLNWTFDRRVHGQSDRGNEFVIGDFEVLRGRGEMSESIAG